MQWWPLKVMIFIERRICRLLDRRGKGSGAEGAVTVYQSTTQNLDDETTAGGALSGTERLLDHDTSLPTDSDDGQCLRPMTKAVSEGVN